ncbi:MAG: Arginine-tRNA ligase [Parcubacteria group bacterium GW2011_GWA1_53_13]|nr:MAG: Arginine-tRNA ligase [Parcubacteria group bacterium GW2011_GWA1_53_13]
MKERIEKAVKEALGTDAPFVVERPRALGHGDYSTNAALVGKADPHELSSKLRSLLGSNEVEKIEVVGKFVNFYLSREALIPKEQKILQSYAGKTIMVEYTDPNPFKEFHIGHLMSNAIGESIARLLESSGARVIRANYQGDVGPHVAKAIWGKMQKPGAAWGEAYAYGAAQYEAHQEEIDAINKKVYERSDETINALYDAGRKESLDRFEGIYKTLGTTFGHYFFESVTGPRGLGVVKAHPELFVESDGAVVYHGPHTRVFVTSKGLPTYETKDLGLAEIKKETAPFDTSITVTANEQSDYFKVVFEALGRVHPEWQGQFTHVSHGMMRFAQGKMSSRTGNVITGESLLEDLTKAARGREDVAVGAIKYSVLKSGSGKDIIFDPEQSLSLEGDSGPYLQYALVRARALLRKAKEAGVEVGKSDFPKEASVLERVLVHYSEVVERAAKELEPHYLTTYLTELASAFNSWYAQEKVIGGPHQNYGVFLTTAVERTLAEGLSLLGIPTPEEM